MLQVHQTLFLEQLFLVSGIKIHHLYDHESAVHMKLDSRLFEFRNDSLHIRIQTMAQISLVTAELSHNKISKKQARAIYIDRKSVVFLTLMVRKKYIHLVEMLPSTIIATTPYQC